MAMINTAFNAYITGNCTVEAIWYMRSMEGYSGKYINNKYSVSEIPTGKAIYKPNTKYVSNWAYAFDSMYNLTGSISDLMSKYDWSNATNIAGTFANCRSLSGSIPYIPDKVEDMQTTYRNCYSITGSIPTIPNSVTNISGAFEDCHNLSGKFPSLPNSVEYIDGTFRHCYNLTGSVNLSSLSKVTNMSYTFTNCMNLTSIEALPPNATHFEYTFAGCSNIKTVPSIPNGVVYTATMFANCSSLNCAVPELTNTVLTTSEMFYNCKNVFFQGNTYNIPSSVLQPSYMFYDCEDNIHGDVYVYSEYLTGFADVFGVSKSTGARNTHINIHARANTNAYNMIYASLGNATTNTMQNISLSTF